MRSGKKCSGSTDSAVITKLVRMGRTPCPYVSVLSKEQGSGWCDGFLEHLWETITQSTKFIFILCSLRLCAVWERNFRTCGKLEGEIILNRVVQEALSSGPVFTLDGEAQCLESDCRAHWRQQTQKASEEWGGPQAWRELQAEHLVYSSWVDSLYV